MSGSSNNKKHFVKGRLPEEFTAIDEVVSTSGKYAIAFGQHFRLYTRTPALGRSRLQTRRKCQSEHASARFIGRRIELPTVRQGDLARNTESNA